MSELSGRIRSLLVGRSPAQIGAAILAPVLLLGGGFWLLKAPHPPVESTLPRARPAATTVTSQSGGTVAPAPSGADPLVVQVAGAVHLPGVYRVGPGSRVTDAIDAAGGVTADADLNAMRLAARLTDGERVAVPKVGEAAIFDPPVSGPTGPIDLNQATAAQLDTLPGVGASTAAAIVAYRVANGRFAAVDELQKVRGIGPSKFEGLRGLVRV